MDRRAAFSIGFFLKTGFAVGRYSPDQRVVMSQFPINKVFQQQHQTITDKPTGLWYAIGNDWIDYIRGQPDISYWEGDYIYLLELDMSQILKIYNENEFEVFTHKYGVSDSEIEGIEDNMPIDINEVMYIDWEKVAYDYSGIEINPYLGYKHQTWYRGWDVASGCIWNPNAIIGMKQVEGPQRGEEITRNRLFPSEDYKYEI